MGGTPDSLVTGGSRVGVVSPMAGSKVDAVATLVDGGALVDLGAAATVFSGEFACIGVGAATFTGSAAFASVNFAASDTTGAGAD